MTRSGMEATLSAVLYSGFFLKREEFSSVEASSVERFSSQFPRPTRRRSSPKLTFVRLLELWLGWQVRHD